MKDNVKIHVIGIQSDLSEDDDTIELITTGSWYQKNNKNYLLYTDTTLLDSVETKTRVSFDDKTVSIIRNGGTNTHLVFEDGVCHIIPYETPFGLFEMVSTTKSIVILQSDSFIDLKVVYHLELNQMDMGLNTFHIRATLFTENGDRHE